MLNQNDKKNVNEEELEEINGGGKPWGTWVPVDEECPDFNRSQGCPFRPFERSFQNCGECKNKNS